MSGCDTKHQNSFDRSHIVLSKLFPKISIRSWQIFEADFFGFLPLHYFHSLADRLNRKHSSATAPWMCSCRNAMEGGKCHTKAGQNVWVCYEGCKNANALHQAIPKPHQCLLIKGLRQCTLAPPTVMNDCRLFGNSQRIYVANPHLSCHAAKLLLDAPRRTRLLSVSSTRPSLKKTTGLNNSDCSTQKFS